MDTFESDFHALNHATDQFSTDLKQFALTLETIINVLKDNIVNLTPTIKVELEQKRSLKIIVALHVTFHQATEPTYVLVGASSSVQKFTDGSPCCRYWRTVIVNLRSIFEEDQRFKGTWKWVGLARNVPSGPTHIHLRPVLSIDVYAIT